MSQNIVVVSAARTAIGSFQGAFASTTAPQLGASAIAAVVSRAGIEAALVDELLMGNVLSAGLGQAPARQAGLAAGLGLATPCTAVSKVCGSGMKAVMLAADQIKAGSADVIIAGGMESMSRSPYILPKARSGQRLGHGEVLDHMFYDGLQDAYDGQLMGCLADTTAREDGITREQMDEYAIESLRRAGVAIKEGYFKAEIAPVTVSSRRGDSIVDTDEQPSNSNAEKIPVLKPAFGKEGLVTAANASSISDGAAALLLMTEDKVRHLGLEPLATIKAYTTHAQEPAKFTHAPIGAIQKVVEMSGWAVADVDLFEVNEAFAMVTLAAINHLGLDRHKVNIHGGATALGHPIGASGARIIVTLLYALKRLGKKRGIASLCIGSGEATAIALEMS